MRSRSTISLGLLAVVTFLLLPIVTNVAAGRLPESWQPYLGWSWLLAALLAAPLVISAVRSGRSAETSPSATVAQTATADRSGTAVQVNGPATVTVGLPAPPAPMAPEAAPAPPAAWLDRARDDVDHGQIFGARDALERLGQALHNPDGDRIISIFGEGGTGKTTLAYEMVKRHAVDAGFTRIAWTSAKFGHMRALGRIEYRRRAAAEWNDLLIDIAAQLGLDIDLSTYRLSERLTTAIGESPDPLLIVIDNLETVSDVDLAMAFLDQPAMLGPHKVAVTTRQSTAARSSLVHEIAWRGLDEAAVRDFARHLADDEPDFLLTPKDLAQIVSVSGGLPLLVKMVVRLAVHEARPVDEVIGRLRNAHGELGGRIGPYLYEKAMDSLTTSDGVGEEAATGLMNAFCALPAGLSLSGDDFFELSLIPDRATFDRARAAARDLALIRGADGNRRFAVHPLLRQYICDGARALS
ncbi:NB-ARC domain-containing protein [Actinoplanes utahensis]|uniref:NB-ARC domain-containing protein n=1 Tax=Actinoplanes utahensis TaxID=1869 RepID=UPI000B1A24A8|nr:NB-ARC domain-containing protein [Actinoplanes utahensis]GIF32275.1 hypothetical protein Aut01nite_52610 [Actinoplanes utahensis]